LLLKSIWQVNNIDILHPMDSSQTCSRSGAQAICDVQLRQHSNRLLGVKLSYLDRFISFRILIRSLGVEHLDK